MDVCIKQCNAAAAAVHHPSFDLPLHHLKSLCRSAFFNAWTAVKHVCIQIFCTFYGKHVWSEPACVCVRMFVEIMYRFSAIYPREKSIENKTKSASNSLSKIYYDALYAMHIH